MLNDWHHSLCSTARRSVSSLRDSRRRWDIITSSALSYAHCYSFQLIHTRDRFKRNIVKLIHFPKDELFSVGVRKSLRVHKRQQQRKLIDRRWYSEPVAVLLRQQIFSCIARFTLYAHALPVYLAQWNTQVVWFLSRKLSLSDIPALPALTVATASQISRIESIRYKQRKCQQFSFILRCSGLAVRCSMFETIR